MTDQPCPFYPPDPAYDAMIRDGVVVSNPYYKPGEMVFGELDPERLPPQDRIDWPVDSHAARAAHGQRQSAQGQPAASVGDFYVSPRQWQDIAQRRMVPLSQVAAHLNRRQLVKRLRARWA